MDTQCPLDLTDFFTLSVDMFTRPTEACQRTWPPPRLLAEKTNDLGCPCPTLSATAAATSVLLHLCHYCYFSSLLSATAACFYSTNPIGHRVILLRLCRSFNCQHKSVLWQEPFPAAVNCSHGHTSATFVAATC